MTYACVVVASEARKGLVTSHVVPSVLDQGFDQVIVATDYHSADTTLYVSTRTHSTLDALDRRQAAFELTTTDYVVYVSDDHILADGFLADLRLAAGYDILVPWRYTVRDGQVIPLNMGQGGKPDRDRNYCAGHAGIYTREILDRHPWTQDSLAHPYWDVEHSWLVLDAGGTICYCSPESRIRVQDVEHVLNPASEPWK